LAGLERHDDVSETCSLGTLFSFCVVDGVTSLSLPLLLLLQHSETNDDEIHKTEACTSTTAAILTKLIQSQSRMMIIDKFDNEN